jgi:hypothetical protein
MIQSIEDYTIQDILTNQSNSEPIQHSIKQIQMNNTPYSEQPEITTVPGEYDALTNDDDYRSYFKKIRNLQGE